MFRIIVGLALAGALGMAGAGWGYEPPEIIGTLTCPLEFDTGFPGEFCWIGDQNGDGFDDLLVSQNWDTLSRVYLYQGGQQIADQPAFTFTPYERPENREFWIGYSISYVGRLSGDIPSVLFQNRLRPDTELILELYYTSEGLENEPYLRLAEGVIDNDDSPSINMGFNKKPLDFNGDGFTDVLYFRNFGSRMPVNMLVCFGGDDFDTIPDWSATLPNQCDGYYEYGFDFNGDGYGDVLSFRPGSNDRPYPTRGDFQIFLGGDPPDTIPALTVSADDYNLLDSELPDFTLIPDINGDGCDEWGAYWCYIPHPEDSLREDSGFYIFLGGAEPDSTPDLQLTDTPDYWKARGPICGGDFNGDGFGDIAVRTGGSDEYHGQDAELQIHFGSPWIAPADVHTKRQPDLFVDLGQCYGGVYAHSTSDFLGAVGDYNGDGVDDFVWEDFKTDRIVIFAGSSRWRVDAPMETNPPTDFTISLTAHPNPFNNEVSLTIYLSQPGQTKLEIFDLSGRLVNSLVDDDLPRGERRFTWKCDRAGVYFARVQYRGKASIRKIVCIP